MLSHDLVRRLDAVPELPIAEGPGEEYCLHLFTVDDPRIWQPRRRLSPDEIAIEGLTDKEWETFDAIIAEG